MFSSRTSYICRWHMVDFVLRFVLFYLFIFILLKANVLLQLYFDGLGRYSIACKLFQESEVKHTQAAMVKRLVSHRKIDWLLQFSHILHHNPFHRVKQSSEINYKNGDALFVIINNKVFIWLS